MVRQDKITFLVSTLETPDLYGCFDYDCDVHDNPFKATSHAKRIFERIGVISKFESDPEGLLTQYLPVNKHYFLDKALLEFSKDYCSQYEPNCTICILDVCCDYYNKKNDWSE